MKWLIKRYRAHCNSSHPESKHNNMWRFQSNIELIVFGLWINIKYLLYILVSSFWNIPVHKTTCSIWMYCNNLTSTSYTSLFISHHLHIYIYIIYTHHSNLNDFYMIQSFNNSTVTVLYCTHNHTPCKRSFYNLILTWHRNIKIDCFTY